MTNTEQSLSDNSTVFSRLIMRLEIRFAPEKEGKIISVFSVILYFYNLVVSNICVNTHTHKLSPIIAR